MRYRHTDTDLVRSARQQDFLSAARQRVPISQLVLGQNSLIDIFTKYTTSDINNAETMLQVLKLFIASRNATIEEVHFPATLGPELRLRVGGRDPRRRQRSSSGSKRAAGRAELASKPAGAAKRAGAPPTKPQPAKPSPPAATGWCRPRKPASSRRRRSPARLAAPSRSSTRPGCRPGPPSCETRPTTTCRTPASTTSRTPDGHRHEAYRMVRQFGPYSETHYFGVQGIQGWSEPADPQQPDRDRDARRSRVRDLHQRRQVRMVAWHRGEDTYWVANACSTR